MYVIPIVLIVLLALIAVAWSPIFALILFVIAFVAYAGLNRRADEKLAAPESPGRQPQHEAQGETGMWGERKA